MKKILILIFTLTMILPTIVSAHPGGTDSSGCHTCRTNCSNWGLSYGEYHCHNNRGSAQPVYPIHSTYGEGGTGYTSPAPDYSYPSIPITPSCPSMSSYNSLTGGCKCYSGYVVGTDYSGKEACVSAESKCTDSLGYGGTYDSISGKCECRYGYLYDGKKCVSESSYCRDSLGLMSRYNSLSERCECMSGYEFNGSSCEYKMSNYGGSSDTNTCPINSHGSLTDSTKCDCDTGFQVNSAKTACVRIPTKTNDETCQSEFGINSTWDGTKNNDGTLNCGCKTGYQFNDSKNKCIVSIASPVYPETKNPEIVSNVEDSPETDKEQKFSFDIKKEALLKNKANTTLRVSGAFRKCPSLNCEVIRYYAETAQVIVLGNYNENEWYKVQTKDDYGNLLTGWMHSSVLNKISMDEKTIVTPTTTPKKIESKFFSWFTNIFK